MFVFTGTARHRSRSCTDLRRMAVLMCKMITEASYGSFRIGWSEEIGRRLAPDLVELTDRVLLILGD